jgi:esterase/lipase
MFSNLSESDKQIVPSYPFHDSDFSFLNYIDYCKALIAERRLDLSQTSLKNKIIEANTPYELRPAAKQPISCGILLIHGLWASPFSMREIADELHAHGLLCRSVLLPGHGTRPSDLSAASHQDWIDAVQFGINSLKKEVEHIFLIGYSAGAALSVYHALKDEKIAGLILMAPAIAVKFMMNIVFEYHQLVKKINKKDNWMYIEEEIDYVKYRSIAFEPALQVYQLSQSVNQLLKTKNLKNPVYVIVSDDDETISSQAAIRLFQNAHSPLKQCLLYTNKQTKSSEFQIRKTQFPEFSIENFSHVCLPFSKNNSHYGQNGDYSRASFLSDDSVYGAYNHVTEQFYKPFFKLGLIKKHKRELTYNPDFHFMTDEIVKFVFKVCGAAKTNTS